MKRHSSDFKMRQGLCFRLLPIQVLLALVGAVNGTVSTLFATNFVGTDAMSVPGAFSCGYQTLRGLIVNMLTLQFVGSVGSSALAASNSFPGLNALTIRL